MKYALDAAIDLVYPPRCVVCDTRILNCEDPAKTLCNSCNPTVLGRIGDDLWSRARRADLFGEGYCECCTEPLLATSETHSRCLACNVNPPLAATVRSLFRYNECIERAIKKLKYGHRFSLVRALATPLVSALSHCDSSQWTLIIPMPSSRQAVSARGFHHTALLARKLSREMNVTLSTSTLVSAGPHPAQVSLRLEARFANAAGAFRIGRNTARGHRVLLIDDVVTTGASIDAATKELLEDGAERVDVFTLARSHQYALNRIRGAFLKPVQTRSYSYVA